VENIRELIETYVTSLSEQKSVLSYRINTLSQEITECKVFQRDTFHILEVMKMTSTVLQNLVDTISTKNITKIEKLLNAALTSIFWDINVSAKIESDVKRNVNLYEIVLYKDGDKGTIKTNGGGIWSVVAIVGKVLSNVLLKGYPLVAFDESLSMISDRYIPATAKFIKDLAKSLNFSVCNVTHKVSFIELSPLVYKVDFAPQEMREFVGKTKRLEKPFINVERSEVREDEEITI